MGFASTLLTRFSYLLIGVFAVLHAAVAEESYRVTLDVAPKFCRTALKLAIRLAARDGNLCAFPGETSDAVIGPLDWKEIEPQAVEPLLETKLPHFGWNTRDSLSGLWAAGKADGKKEDQIQAEIWTKVGAAMQETLKREPGSLKVTRADVDNDGASELVYETITLEPNDVRDVSKGWHPLACSRDSEHLPYHSFFFDAEHERSMGILGLLQLNENNRLVRYRGKIYLAYVTSTMIELTRIGRGPSGVWIDPLCHISK
jgi:hypothetical protein